MESILDQKHHKSGAAVVVENAARNAGGFCFIRLHEPDASYATCTFTGLSASCGEGRLTGLRAKSLHAPRAIS